MELYNDDPDVVYLKTLTTINKPEQAIAVIKKYEIHYECIIQKIQTRRLDY